MSYIDNITQFIEEATDCHEIHKINDSWDLWKDYRCDFAKNVDDCQPEDGFGSYVQIAYCTLGSSVVSIIVYLLWTILLFIALGASADDFLCPAMIVMSKAFRLSNNVAGVTLLAFGNGCTDVFTSISGVRNAGADLVIGELLGAGIFITCLVFGSILITTDFKMMERPLLRDLSFYMISAFLVWWIFYNGTIRLWHAIGVIALYFVYVIVVVSSGYIYRRIYGEEAVENPETDLTLPELKRKLSSARNSRNSSRRNSSIRERDNGLEVRWADKNHNSKKNSLELEPYPIHNHYDSPVFTVSNNNNNNNMKDDLENGNKHVKMSDDSYPVVSRLEADQKSGKNRLMRQISTMSIKDYLCKDPAEQWKDFLDHIIPIDMEDFKEMGWINKIYTIVKTPLVFLLILTVPVVDHDSDRHNWCKVLNILHLFTSPQVFLLLTKLSSDGNLNDELIIVGVSFVLAVIVFFTSENSKPPVYHVLYSFLGVMMAVVWIYSETNEIVSVLGACGVILDISDIILGLTVLAWGNSVGDFFADLSMAKRGYPRMGISACFGGPMFNLLLGIGLPYTFLIATDDSKKDGVEVEYSNMITLLYVTLSFSLGATLMVLIFKKFRSSKIHGVCLIILFIVFTLIACFLELNII